MLLTISVHTRTILMLIFHSHGARHADAHAMPHICRMPLSQQRIDTANATRTAALCAAPTFVCLCSPDSAASPAARAHRCRFRPPYYPDSSFLRRFVISKFYPLIIFDDTPPLRHTLHAPQRDAAAMPMRFTRSGGGALPRQQILPRCGCRWYAEHTRCDSRRYVAPTYLRWCGGGVARYEAEENINAH